MIADSSPALGPYSIESRKLVISRLLYVMVIGACMGTASTLAHWMLGFASVADLTSGLLITGGAILGGVIIHVVNTRYSVDIAGYLLVLLLFIVALAVNLSGFLPGTKGGLLIFSLPICTATLAIRPKSGIVAASASSIAAITLVLSPEETVAMITAIIIFFALGFISWQVTSLKEKAMIELISAHGMLQRNEERYRTLVDSSPEGIVVVHDEIILFANLAAMNLLNARTDPDIIGKSVYDFIAEGSREIAQEYFSGVQSRQLPAETTLLGIIRLDGSSLQAEVTAIPIHYEGKPGIQVLLRDLTEVKSMESTIKRLFSEQVESNRLAIALGETLEPIRVYRTVHEHVSRLLDTKSFIVALYDDQEEVLVAAYEHAQGSELDVSGFPPIPLEPEGQGTQSRVVRTGRYFYTPDVAKALEQTTTSYSFDEDGEVKEGSPPQDQEMSSRSALYVPMKVGGKVAGVMQIQSHLPDAYTQRDIDLFSGLANVAALAVHKALIFEALEESNVELQRVAEELTDRVEERELLLKEVHHRVKNNLQVISSILYLQSKSVADDKTAALLTDSQSRIRAMSLVHELLYSSEEKAAVDMIRYVKELIDFLFSSYGVQKTRIKPILNLEKIKLPLVTAVPCAIVLNEIITNVLKHAFPENNEGEVEISLRLTENNYVELTVHDNGVGLPSNFDLTTETRLGLRMIKNLVEKQLRGTVQLDGPEGTRFVITFSKEEG